MGMGDFLPFILYATHFVLAFGISKIFTDKLSNRDRLIVLWYIYIVIVDITQCWVYILATAIAGPLLAQASFYTAALRGLAQLDSRLLNDDPTVWSAAFFGAFIETFLSIALIRSIVKEDEWRNFLETALPVAQLVNFFHMFTPEVYAGRPHLSVSPINFALLALSSVLYVMLPIWILSSARGVKNGGGSSGGSPRSSPRGRSSRSR